MWCSTHGTGSDWTLSWCCVPPIDTILLPLNLLLLLLINLCPPAYPHPHLHQHFTPTKRTYPSPSMSFTPLAADMGPRWEDGGRGDGGGDGRCWEWGCECSAIGASFLGGVVWVGIS